MFVAATPGCGGELTGETGVVISPNYPNAYPPNVQCVWTITVPSTEVVTLNFTHLDMETHANCRYDFLEVFLIGRFECRLDSSSQNSCFPIYLRSLSSIDIGQSECVRYAMF